MNHDGEQSYGEYSVAELREAISAIDSTKYPVNFKNLVDEFATRGIEIDQKYLVRSEQAQEAQSLYATLSREKTEKSIGSLAWYLFLSIFLFGYIAYNIASGEVVLHTRSGRDIIKGDAALVFCIFMAMAVITNSMRLAARLRYGNADNAVYRSGTAISRIGLFLFICYAVFSIFAGDA